MLPITSALRISKSMQPSEVMDTNNPPESQMSSSVDCDNNPPESQMPSSVDGENIPPDTQMPSSVDAVKDAQAFANEYLRMDPPRPQGRLIVCRLLKVHLQKAIEHAQRRRMSLELSNSYNDSNADLDHVIFVRRQLIHQYIEHGGRVQVAFGFDPPDSRAPVREFKLRDYNSGSAALSIEVDGTKYWLGTKLQVAEDVTPSDFLWVVIYRNGERIPGKSPSWGPLGRYQLVPSARSDTTTTRQLDGKDKEPERPSIQPGHSTQSDTPPQPGSSILTGTPPRPRPSAQGDLSKAVSSQSGAFLAQSPCAQPGPIQNSSFSQPSFTTQPGSTQDNSFVDPSILAQPGSSHDSLCIDPRVLSQPTPIEAGLGQLDSSQLDPLTQPGTSMQYDPWVAQPSVSANPGPSSDSSSIHPGLLFQPGPSMPNNAGQSQPNPSQPSSSESPLDQVDAATNPDLFDVMRALGM